MVEIEHLKAILAKMRRERYGRSSEKLDALIAQLELGLDDAEIGLAGDCANTLKGEDHTIDAQVFFGQLARSALKDFEAAGVLALCPAPFAELGHRQARMGEGPCRRAP